MKLLQVEDLSFRYPDQEDWLFSGLNFSLSAGQIMAISGNNGSGKTSLLYLLAGIIPRHRQGEIAGNISLAGINHKNADLSQLSTIISLVMQQPEDQIFFPTVEQELAFAPENLCLSVPEIEQRIDQALRLLNIYPLRFADTDKLSFGQQKLVALAAIHTLQPAILLLDEISSGLDEVKLAAVIKLIREYAASGKAVIIADHHSRLIELAEYVINLSKT
ncbi:MAG: energy-coupling factor ABC transporter ATP-binding protein [Candidatus Cloacimonetes bacterium]|nr:energy-coupling factor ABC transporter ATP-binding protein [Candidatus Cloacimonadota bacterium]